MRDDLPDVFTMENCYFYFHPSKCKLFVDGIDQSLRCFAFSLKEQWADVYKKDEKGRPYRDGVGRASERLHGKIDVEGWYE